MPKKCTKVWSALYPRQPDALQSTPNCLSPVEVWTQKFQSPERRKRVKLAEQEYIADAEAASWQPGLGSFQAVGVIQDVMSLSEEYKNEKVPVQFVQGSAPL